MKVRRRNGNLVITLPLLDEPRLSKSGKSLLMASTRGVRRSKLKVNSRRILYVANVFAYPDGESRSASGSARKRGSKKASSAVRLRRRDK